MNGSEVALARLIHKYWKDIYFLSLTYLQNAQHAEEVTQDVFTRIWLTRDRLADIGHFKNYLFIITRNLVFSELRKSLHREPVDLCLSYNTDIADRQVSPEKQLELKEYAAKLEQAIERLPEKRKQVFRLSRQEGLSYTEIAARLDIKPSTVNDHITAALNCIRTYLRNELPGTLIGAAGILLLMDWIFF